MAKIRKHLPADINMIKEYLNGSLELIKEKGPIYACKHGINMPSFRLAKEEIKRKFPKNSKEARQVAYIEKVLKMCKRSPDASR